jgi:hypothetical protein
MPAAVCPFTVVARPAQPDPDAGDDPVLALTVFDKVFTGPLTATSVVRMVSAGAAGAPLSYVALERVEGSLEGRSGAFVLQHVGTITANGPTLDLEVVAGSGTGELAGLSGRGTIVHTAEGARLELDYALPG